MVLIKSETNHKQILDECFDRLIDKIKDIIDDYNKNI